MNALLGKETYERLVRENVFHQNDSTFMKQMAYSMKEDPESWNGFVYLNSEDPDKWGRLLYKILWLQPGGWGDGSYSEQHDDMVNITRVLSNNWVRTIH